DAFSSFIHFDPSVLTSPSIVCEISFTSNGTPECGASGFILCNSSFTCAPRVCVTAFSFWSTSCNLVKLSAANSFAVMSPCFTNSAKPTASYVIYSETFISSPLMYDTSIVSQLVDYVIYSCGCVIYISKPPIRVNLRNSVWVDLFTHLPYLHNRYRILPRNLHACLLIYSVFHQVLLLFLRCLSPDPF